MARYRGAVEQARKELREKGWSTADARKMAPRIAEMRQAQQDMKERPYSWLGGPSHENVDDDF